MHRPTLLAIALLLALAGGDAALPNGKAPPLEGGKSWR
jgi:hypothetical protein